jgi:epoxide hydrolase 4
MSASPSVRRVSLREVSLEVTELGAGPPVLLLHGFPECAYSWRHQMRALADAGFRAIAPDQRGYNRSDKPAELGAYRYERIVADAAELLDALELPRAHVVGHDWGGSIAWGLASLQPSRVDRLVVMNGPHPRHARREIFLNPLQLRRSYYMFVFQVPFIAERVVTRPGFMRAAMRGTAVQREAFDEEALAVFSEAIQQPGAARGALNWYRASMRYGLPQLPQVLARTLCIWGDQDRALGPRLARPPARYVRDIEVRHISDAGHWVQQERPDEVNAHLLEFLRR